MNYFSWKSFQIFEQDLSRILLGDSVFILLALIYTQNFRKATSKKSIFKVGGSESINKIL